MDDGLNEILQSDRKSKAKVKLLVEALQSGDVEPDACRRALARLDAPERGTVVEALEGVSRKQPALVDGRLFDVLVTCLSDPAARVRWESSRTLGNVAAHHPRRLKAAVAPLLANTKHEGTVVRWATAHAVVALLRAGCDDGDLAAAAQKLAKSETDAGVRKIYAAALRKTPAGRGDRK